MKDKVAQRERTEMIVGGARTFNEFVKERASASNITPACVRSLPEIKEEWKQIKARQLAEKKAEKTASKEAKKAEKKAIQNEKKAEKKSITAVAKEKTAIKKVAKKSAVDAENIKMILVEKAHQKSQSEKPPAEPKVKGRPKKYATAEEARRAKIEATKVLNKAKKAQQPPKPPKTDSKRNCSDRKRNCLDPDVQDAELRIYLAKTDKDLDEVLKSIRKASVKYDKLDDMNQKSYDHTLQIYSQKRQHLTNLQHKIDDEKKAESARKKKDKETARQVVEDGKAERQRNIEMFKNAKSMRGKGFNPDALKEFENYGKIQEHLGQHLSDLKEAIDPKDLRDYIHFTKEKARLKSKLVGGMVRHLSGGMERKDLFNASSEPRSLLEQVISQTNTPQLEEWLRGMTEEDEQPDGGFYYLIRQLISAELHARHSLMASQSPRPTQRKNLFGKGRKYSSSDDDSESESDLEGGGDFFGNIGRALKTSWNSQPQTKAEKGFLDFTLNTAEPALLTPLNILAPPVGKVGEAQRKLLKSQYNI